MAHRKQGFRFENDWTMDHLETRSIPFYDSIQTVPVNVEIKADQIVLDLKSAKQILGKANKISVMDCNCRKTRGNCEAPLDVCIDMNEIAERNIADGRAREINLDEALSVLEMSHNAGLVHMALSIESGIINSICSCCSCCCTQLSGLIRFGLAPHILAPIMKSATEESICTQCGVCADRCQFGARKIIDGFLYYYPDTCFGCGLCVSTCPTGAITLVD